MRSVLFSILIVLALASVAPPAVGGEIQIASVRAEGACVALTFDDGPSITETPRLLAILEREHVRATFFMVGQRVAAWPAVAKRVYDDGHEIGNHSWNHPFYTLISNRDVRWQISETDTVIQKATGVVPVLLRVPGGRMSSRIVQLDNRPYVGWSVDPLDWLHHDAISVARTVVAEARSGSIIILHDIHPTTVDAVPAIIKGLRARRFTFVTVSDLLRYRCEAPPTSVAVRD